MESKIVLRYDIITTCAYCKTKTGEIVPNGGWEIRKNKTDGHHWLEGNTQTDSCHMAPYGFNIYVEPQKLTRWIFPDKTEHKEYLNLEDDEVKDDSTLDWLNSICSITYMEENRIKDIDYTEEVGLFFKNTILYVCNLNEKLKKVFGDEIVIAKNQNLLTLFEMKK